MEADFPWRKGSQSACVPGDMLHNIISYMGERDIAGNILNTAMIPRPYWPAFYKQPIFLYLNIDEYPFLIR